MSAASPEPMCGASKLDPVGIMTLPASRVKGARSRNSKAWNLEKLTDMGVRRVQAFIPRSRQKLLNLDRLPWVSMAREVFSFPNPVNEKAARVVAGFVLLLSVCTLATGAYWLLIPLAYGFW